MCNSAIFFRHIQTHDYVLIVDTDEVVLPLKEKTWQAMIKKSISNIRAEPTAISLQNVFKFSPKNQSINASFFDNIYRSQKIQTKEFYGKSFIR